ncbi:hypothetical protein BDZ45DRAFT_697273 [Acephala macrosclerotiorum]|nr:hypothetical protein BDZ45DRAFT_697273 [Acephala macrosclerotiorum]
MLDATKDFLIGELRFPTPILCFVNACMSENCLRLGRECSYTQVLPQKSQEEDDKAAPAFFQASEQAWLTKISPRDFQMYYCPPHHRDIPSSTISVIQQAQEISRRPMPRSCLLTIAQHYTPKYNHLAAEHECMKHAIVSFAAHMHFQATKSQISQEVCIQHIGLALKQLQKDILAFGPDNSDAVVTASIFLAGTAQDWWALLAFLFERRTLLIVERREQWAVFVDDLRKSNMSNEQVLLGALFYALVLTVVPLLPASFSKKSEVLPTIYNMDKICFDEKPSIDRTPGEGTDFSRVFFLSFGGHPGVRERVFWEVKEYKAYVFLNELPRKLANSSYLDKHAR